MTCFFNIGLDAWISNEFEQYRTTKRCLNKAYYFWLFLKLGCCNCNIMKIKHVIDNVAEIDDLTFEKDILFTSD